MYCSSIVKYNESFSKKNWVYDNITRPFNIIYYIYGGKGYYKINGETFQFKKEHLYIMPANTTFSMWQDENNNLQHLFIHAFVSPELNNLICIDTTTDNFLAQTVKLMKKYIRHTDTIYIRKLTEMLFSYLSEINKNDNQSLSVAIKNHIDNNFLKVFKNGDISTVFNYSNSHLTKIFRSEYGITPKQYCKQIVLKYIISLLHENYSVKYISETLDFSSPEHFSRFFKQNYGCSPRDYIKKHF